MRENIKKKQKIEFNDLGLNLPALQKVELELLIEFDRICRKHKINYQLFAGTLLGAVRHKGFIPWDDDIDICLLRKDYNKFLEVCETELNEAYFLQTHETTADKYHSFARIRKNDTLAIQDAFSELDIHHGIFIDLFPLDKVETVTFRGKLQRFFLYKVKTIKRLKLRKEILKTKAPYKRWIKQLMSYLFKPISLQRLNRLETKIATMFENTDVQEVTLLADGDEKEYWRYLTTIDEFRNVIELEFENKFFFAPKSYHNILKQNFGSYMELPPTSERIPHHQLIHLSFDTQDKQRRKQ